MALDLLFLDLVFKVAPLLLFFGFDTLQMLLLTLFGLAIKMLYSRRLCFGGYFLMKDYQLFILLFLSRVAITSTNQWLSRKH